jgi:hypothetical protein
MLLRKLNLPVGKITVNRAVMAVFILSLGYYQVLGKLNWTGWTKTPLIDFQNERLLPYFLLFLLGAVCYSKGILENDRRNMKLYIAVNATSWCSLSAKRWREWPFSSNV